MLFAMALLQQFQLLLVWIYALVTGSFSRFHLFITLYALYRVVKSVCRFLAKPVTDEDYKELSAPHVTIFDGRVAENGNHAQDGTGYGHSCPTTDDVQELLKSIVEELIKPLKDDSSAARTELMTAKDQLAVVAAELSAVRKMAQVQSEEMPARMLSDAETMAQDAFASSLREEFRQCMLEVSSAHDAQLKELHDLVREQAGTIVDLQRDLSKLPKTVEEVRMDMRHHIDTLESAVEKQKVTQGQISGLKKEVTDQATKIFSLNSAVDILMDREAKSEKPTDVANMHTGGEISGLQDQIVAINEHLTELRSVLTQVDALDNRVTMLEDTPSISDADRKQIDKITDLRAEVAKVEQALKALKKTAAESAEEITDLLEKVQKHSDLLKEDEADINKAFSNIKAVDDKVDAQSVTIHDLSDRVYDCEDQIDSLKRAGTTAEAVGDNNGTAAETSVGEASTEMLQGPTPPTPSIVPALQVDPSQGEQLPPAHDPSSISQTAFTFTTSYPELSFTPARKIKACRAPSRRTDASTSTPGPLPASSSAAPAPPLLEATTSAPPPDTTDAAAEHTERQQEPDEMETDAYDTSMIPASQADAEDYMLTAGEERPESDEEDAVGESDDETYGPIGAAGGLQQYAPAEDEYDQYL